MKVCVVQIKPFKGDIEKNIKVHKDFVQLAISHHVDAIFFPELSITGYEPLLAQDLATNQEDKRFDDFQRLSDSHQITIGFGVPTKINTGIKISMIIFQPEAVRQTYSKQHLHSDECPYFVPGEYQLILTMKNEKIAPAICYESLLPAHSENAIKSGATVYMASVAKSENGVEKAFDHFSDMASRHSLFVAMANCVGNCDDFESAGKTSVWNQQGKLIGQLNNLEEGALIFDTNTHSIIMDNI
ncbi:carbon-nitrogen hydrolase family protein [Fulvivirga sp. M361]|uniref:carbon-nitrogen hydrolase family protein n=1 Tax=Fulvivirga sp. M361 TaxID=2594266 RepID=UPI00117A7B1D|nr:carbon-nitrogen hydrolase family protein [Fulvivirga sp. M361]TRX51987.1 carbon-nitrogen hydrolase family protein [Fulvivirga sp. M361]